MAEVPLIKPFSQSQEIKNPKVFNLNYTNQDFYSMKTRMIEFIKERFGENGTVLPNTFNDFVESSIAIMLIENFAFLADTLSFKMDQIVNELFIDTVTEIENAFRLSKLVGFQPQPPIAARSLWSATINQSLSTDLRIETPVPIDIGTADGTLNIELFAADSDNQPIFGEDIIVPAGDSVNASIVGLEGVTRTEDFTGTGEVGQTFPLTFTPVIWESVQVEVNGASWDQVEYFTDSQRRPEYRVEFDSDYNGYIIFGNNRSGLIPTPGSVIRATYRVGGGTIGNIVTGFIQTQRQVFVPGLEFSIPITFRNYTKGEYGYDGDSIEDIRMNLPKWLRTQNRAVSGLDYKTLTDLFATPYNGKIGKSTAVLRNHGCAGNVVDLYILALKNTNELENASNELKVALNETLNEKKMITDYVCIKNGAVLLTDVSVDVILDRNLKKFELELKENITNKISDFFALSNWDYGKSLKDTDLIKELSDIKQIKSISITFTTSDPDNSGSLVVPEFYEIIRPDDTNISFIFE